MNKGINIIKPTNDTVKSNIRFKNNHAPDNNYFLCNSKVNIQDIILINGTLKTKLSIAFNKGKANGTNTPSMLNKCQCLIFFILKNLDAKAISL